MSTFQTLALPLLFSFFLNPLIKTLSEQLYYNLHNKLQFFILPQVPFLHHAIITAFADDSNHSETDFYALNKFKYLLLSSMELGPVSNCQASRCALTQVLPQQTTAQTGYSHGHNIPDSQCVWDPTCKLSRSETFFLDIYFEIKLRQTQLLFQPF